MEYTAKHFVHHARQLQAIQRTRNSVPLEPYSHLVNGALESPAVAKFFGLSEKQIGSDAMRDRIELYLADLGIVPTDWKSDKA